MHYYNQLNRQYIDLLQQAEETVNRKEAIQLINKADRVRSEMCSLDEARLYPHCH
jgi:hypothetical protein